MDFNIEILVIGCGLSGAVTARELAEKGYQVTIWERRDHIGGNMYDYVDEHGFLVQKYGPHTFHTKKKELYDYMCRYGQWEDYKLTCGAEIDGKCTPTPFNFQTIDDFYAPEEAETLKQHLKQAFGDRETATVVEVLSNPEPIVRKYAQFLFEKDYSLYTAKQWGVSPEEIDPSVLKRVPLRFSYDIGYLGDTYEIMAKESFTSFFVEILNHPNIRYELNVEALDHLKVDGSQLLLDGKPFDAPVIYTGALDALFGFEHGALPYRSLRFDWKYSEVDSLQDMPVVAYPQAEGYTRITEYKKLPVQNKKGSTYAVEYPLQYVPGSGSEPYYPVLTRESQAQYAKYICLAERIPNLFLCGRLADFKYYNMDQALERALSLVKEFEKAV